MGIIKNAGIFDANLAFVENETLSAGATTDTISNHIIPRNMELRIDVQAMLDASTTLNGVLSSSANNSDWTRS